MDNRYGAFIDSELTVGRLGNGILDGMTFAVKDVYAIAGHSSSAGNPDWLRSHNPSTEHAAVVRQLLQSGATLRGATHTDELMYSLGGENHHYGTPINPRAAGCIPGGSSSGSAVAVASGSVDFALGTDTGGSIRVPSSYCGVYGFRPTHGAVNMEGVIPLSPQFDTVGWMADRMGVLQKVGEVLLGSGRMTEKVMMSIDGNLELNIENGREKNEEEELENNIQKKMRTLFIATDCWDLVDPKDVRSVLVNGLNQLKTGADHFFETEIAPEGLKVWMDVFRELQGSEIWTTHCAWIEKVEPFFGPDIAARFSWAASLAGKDHSIAQNKRKEISTQLRKLLGEDNCLVIPTVPGPAPLRGGDLRQLEENRSGAMMLSCIAGLAGLPQVTLPMLSTNGLPLGLSVIAGHGQDLRLLSWVKEVWRRS
ncbi:MULTISPECIES: amidase family protein [Paenibacillus]|uniref:Amidase n=1 Tax=Paenibacillus odorifer TaxID=189426 RepID=A0ABX3HWY4_9BACL|nr:amidase family protein [Paenibacillus odorifer]OMD55381.1 amidase [Paenibacillus odorifer]